MLYIYDKFNVLSPIFKIIAYFFNVIKDGQWKTHTLKWN